MKQLKQEKDDLIKDIKQSYQEAEKMLGDCIESLKNSCNKKQKLIMELEKKLQQVNSKEETLERLKYLEQQIDKVFEMLQVLATHLT